LRRKRKPRPRSSARKAKPPVAAPAIVPPLTEGLGCSEVGGAAWRPSDVSEDASSEVDVCGWFVGRVGETESVVIPSKVLVSADEVVVFSSFVLELVDDVEVLLSVVLGASDDFSVVELGLESLL
jgi:hypothetical protein